MPKVQKDPSKFLEEGDVKDQEIVRIADAGEEVESQFGTRLQLGIKVPSGLVKILTLNPTSKANLIDEFGGDTDLWVGKEVRVHLVKTMVSGKVKMVTYLTHANKDLEGNHIVQG